MQCSLFNDRHCTCSDALGHAFHLGIFCLNKMVELLVHSAVTFYVFLKSLLGIIKSSHPFTKTGRCETVQAMNLFVTFNPVV